mgnify:CR=1 FL=1
MSKKRERKRKERTIEEFGILIELSELKPDSIQRDLFIHSITFISIKHKIK